MAPSTKTPPFKLFVSYSHKDEELCTRFLEQLAQLRREGFIEAWYDRQIGAGRDWAGQINDNLKAADVIVLLVSPGFLASDYSNDVEMDCAIQRSDAGEARVVPIILRPCDWETSRFGKLQALPTGAKPVVDWKSSDHGFLDAVKQLRRMLVDMCQPGPGRVQVVVKAAVRRHPWRWAGVGLAAAAAIACLVLWLVGRRYSQEGIDLLNRGAYGEALDPLQRAHRLNPLDRKAACGIKVIQVQKLIFSPDKIDSAVIDADFKEVKQQFPNCAYVDLLQGTYNYLNGDLVSAAKAFWNATNKEPGLAEAHANLGFMLKLDGQPQQAIDEYQLAVDAARTSPSYRTLLAGAYFEIKDYDKALQEYDKAGRFPLAGIQAGIIYRLQDKLPDAEDRDLEAVHWLQESSVRNADQRAWAQQAGPEPADKQRMRTPEEKLCYSELELAATRLLMGPDKEKEASEGVSRSFGKCDSRKSDLSSVLKWELHQLAEQTPKLAQRADEFANRFLGGRYVVGN